MPMQTRHFLHVAFTTYTHTYSGMALYINILDDIYTITFDRFSYKQKVCLHTSTRSLLWRVWVEFG